MEHRGYYPKEERVARSRLAQLVHCSPFIYGSVVTSERKCGKANCWCRKKKKGGHVSSYLSVRVGKSKKRKMIFIPQRMVKKVQEWIRTHKEITHQMIKISESCVERVREE